MARTEATSPFILLAFFLLFRCTTAVTSYDNVFVDPDFIVSKNFSINTSAAQATIVQWAQQLSSGGPWSVTQKSVVAPSGDKHDYMSWAPYAWPDCSSVGNTTALSDEEVWKTCPYVTRDGQINPDSRLINDAGEFSDLADAVMYNAISSVLSGNLSNIYSQNAVTFLKTWFLDSDTKMNPNLNYAQMQRGPNGQVGQHDGVLDLKAFAKIGTGILILRKSNNTDYTSDVDNGLISWCKEYITWLESAKIALQEANATNNHGTFYYNQLSALKLIVNDNEGALNATNTYFSKQFMSQIVVNGEQPYEMARTRPYHYSGYNLAAMITNARITKYADPTSSVWDKTTTTGATIKTALDFVMALDPEDSNEASYASELYPSVAAIAAAYGDSDGTYAGYLGVGDPNYAKAPYFLWSQPLRGGTAAVSSTSSAGHSKATHHSSSNSNAAAGLMTSKLAIGSALLISILVIC